MPKVEITYYVHSDIETTFHFSQTKYIQGVNEWTPCSYYVHMCVYMYMHVHCTCDSRVTHNQNVHLHSVASDAMWNSRLQTSIEVVKSF